MAVKTPYLERTLASIEAQCAVRGIPQPEIESVRAHIQQKYGKALDVMSDHELKKVNQNLPALFVDYLDGQKRRTMPAPRASGGDAKAKGSINIKGK